MPINTNLIQYYSIIWNLILLEPGPNHMVLELDQCLVHSKGFSKNFWNKWNIFLQASFLHLSNANIEIKLHCASQTRGR